MNQYSRIYGAVAKWQGEGRQNLFGGSIPPRAPNSLAYRDRKWTNPVTKEKPMSDPMNSTTLGQVLAFGIRHKAIDGSTRRVRLRGSSSLAGDQASSTVVLAALAERRS